MSRGAVLLGVVLGMTLHEWAHARVATAAGDPTAAVLGRLSLNPLRHVDPIGSVLVPALTLALTGYVFGWARAVPVDTRWFRGDRGIEALVYIAGPLANVFLACVLGLAGLAPAAYVNVILAGFNLLPVPGLDGWRLLRLWARKAE